MFTIKPLRSLLLIGALAALTACVPPEEKANDYVQKGLALVQQGDYARAYVEFRNALKEVPDHRPTLKAFAEALEAEGKSGEAYRYQLKLAELSPDDAQINLVAAQQAVTLQDWKNAEVYGRKAAQMLPDDPAAQAVGLMLDYRSKALAVMDQGNGGPLEGEETMLAKAQALMKQLPDNEIPYTIAVDVLSREGRDAEALSVAQEMVKRWPDQLAFQQVRLQLLARTGDEAGIETALRDMVTRFPDDTTSKTQLIQFYMAQNRPDEVEAFLRSQIPAGKADDTARGNLIQFLEVVHGRDAARAELDKMIAEGTNTALFTAMGAVLDFQVGKKDEAIATLEGVLADAKPSDQTHEIRVMLSKILMATGNQVGARQQVETVLAEDPGMVGALQMQAAWLIDGDKTDEAISVLRQALDQEPNNPDSSTLLAQAYLRAGDRQLAGEMLARATSDANNRPAEALRQARFLIDDKKWLPAESVLIASLRVSPNNPDLLATLGIVYVQMADWARADHVERTLRDLKTPQAVASADQIKVAILHGQQRDSDALAFLQDKAAGEGGDVAAQIAVLRSHIAKGDLAQARQYLDRLLAQKPDDQTYRFLDAALTETAGDRAGAIERYAKLVADFPKEERLWMEYYRVLAGTGQQDEADKILNEGLAALPDGANLNWALAGRKEKQGDIDGAIAIYEKLYAMNSSSSILANNLASLIATSRTDQESLDRAWNVARRLRDSDVPAFQDTYGWIAYLRGEYDEARRNLEPAAKGLPEDPSVAYHLGMTYAALGRKDDALATLEAAKAKAESLDTPVTRPLAATIGAEIAKLQAAPSAPVAGQ